jgi:hypothetical protein
MVVDPTLRVHKSFSLNEHGAIYAYLDLLPPVGRSAGFEFQVSVVVSPEVLEPELCRQPTDLYEAQQAIAISP